jgi:hemin uptake protein HemP
MINIPMFTIKKDTWGHEFEHFVHEQIVDKSSFITTFSKEIQSAIRVIKSVPLLVHDHQILVNDKGNIYQFDLDRALHAGYSGKLNDGQSYTNWTFQNSFITDYNRTMEVLLSASAWATTGRQQIITKQDTIDLHSNISDISPSAESVIMNHHNGSTSLISCKVVEIVNELIEKEKVTVEAKSMMADLVAFTLDRSGNNIERKNCSIA